MSSSLLENCTSLKFGAIKEHIRSGQVRSAWPYLQPYTRTWPLRCICIPIYPYRLSVAMSSTTLDISRWTAEGRRTAFLQYPKEVHFCVERWALALTNAKALTWRLAGWIHLNRYRSLISRTRASSVGASSSWSLSNGLAGCTIVRLMLASITTYKICSVT